MRHRIRVGLVLVCLGLVGCGLFDRNGGKKPDNKPFTGLPKGEGAAAAPTAAADPDVPPGADGFLAGQVLNKNNNRRLNKAFIQVVDLQNPRPTDATLNVETDTQGYFAIRGLQRGKHYQLIARGREDGPILAGAVLATPPDPKLCIMVSEDLVSPSTPAIPAPPSFPGQAPGEKGARPTGPAAVLETPTRVMPEASSPGTARGVDPVSPQGAVAAPGGSNPFPGPAQPVPPGDSSRTAWTDDPNRGGFDRVAPPPPKPASIPGSAIPPPPNDPVPPINPPPVNTQPATPDPSATPASAWSNEPAPVPSCDLRGRRLHNLALYTLEGQAWEYRRHHQGRVVLLDFWSTRCAPCLHAIDHLSKLQQTYGPYGLEVIGIAYETGHFNEQVQKIRSVRGRMVMGYKTLVGGGDSGPCPVKTTFDVNFLPTLVLLDETGTVVWRSGQEGLSDERKRELENEIRLQLRLQWPNNSPTWGR